jgi:hypothetical protein
VSAGRNQYRFDELGWLQFERLCLELLERSVDLAGADRRLLPSGRAFVLSEGGSVPGEGRKLSGPTVVLIAWSREPNDLSAAIDRALAEWPRLNARSLLVLTNARGEVVQSAELDVAWLGPVELSALVAESWPVRLRVPSVLGIGAAEELLAEDVAQRSTADLQAALDLARVFVPTSAHAAAVDVLARHHFVVLTGPPEMGKTAIARMVGLAALTDGWEVHECVRPDELWARFRRDHRQVFIADDAFGSTEYRPEAAERWALELDRVLRAMDERHWLIWTSRPAPLKAGLRRIHREHGVERFPRPAEVQVDAAELDVAEKALILFRHAKAAALPEWAIDLVRREGWAIVSHPHFTPERIRRFVARRLLQLAGDSAGDVNVVVALEIREPTNAMAASFGALADDHRSLLVALLDTPPGPVSERDLVAAFRRHAATGFPRQPAELVDRLTDHFLRAVEGTSVTWVHPSWRDLVIEQLVEDDASRQDFLRSSSLEGILLAVSTAGGSAGERLLPLLRADCDWDALADRLAVVISEAGDPDLTRLFASLAEAATARGEDSELDALAGYTLELVARRWDRERTVIPVGLLASWFEVAALVRRPPNPPELAPTWIELLPTGRIDPRSASDLGRLDDWSALAELLHERVPEALSGFGFPERFEGVVGLFVEEVEAIPPKSEPAPRRELLARILWRMSALMPRHSGRAEYVANRLASVREEGELPATYDPRPISRELRRLLDAPPAVDVRRSGEELVARVLRDL